MPDEVDPPARTREIILDTAQEFLLHKRLREMTVSALMEPIPVTREAFYKHFTSRYDVVAALLGRFTAEVAEDFDIWLRGTDPVRDVPTMFDAASHTYLRRATLLRAVVDAAPLDPNLEAVWRAFLGHFIDAGTQRIRADQASGLASSCVDAGLAAAGMIHLVERVITQELASPTPPPREQVVALLSHAMLGLLYPTASLAHESPSPRNGVRTTVGG